MFQGFRTKEEIKNDWIGLYGSNTGEGISDLLDNILLVSEMNNYRANPNRYAVGTVVE